MPLKFWRCGTMKREAIIAMNRVIRYQWVPVDGCGQLNHPLKKECMHCGRKGNGGKQS